MFSPISPVLALGHLSKLAGRQASVGGRTQSAKCVHHRAARVRSTDPRPNIPRLCMPKFDLRRPIGGFAVVRILLRAEPCPMQ